MKRSFKAIGFAAALAVMVPLSASAAVSQDGGKTAASPAKAFSAIGKWKGEHFGKGFVGQDILDLLKLDAAAFKAKLAEGKTLAQIAEEQGVSRDALKKAMTDSFNKKLEEQKQKFADNLDKMIDAKGGRFPDIRQEFKAFPGAGLSAVAEILGMTDADLKKSLGSGKSPADLAKEKGIDVQKLIDAQKTAITNAIEQAVKNGKLTREKADTLLKSAGDMAEKIVNGHPGGKFRGHGDRKDSGR